MKAYAAWSSINEATARRALQEFLPKEAVNPDRMSGLDDIVADAVTFKYIPAPLTSAQLSELIRFRNASHSSHGSVVGVANIGEPRRNWHARRIARIWRKPGPITAIHPKSAPVAGRRIEGCDREPLASRTAPACTERSVIRNPSGWIRAASVALRVMIG